MGWSGEELRAFVRDHLGPTFEREGIDQEVGIFLSTFPVNDFDGFVFPALNDSAAAKYLSGVGLQYAGVGMIEAIRASPNGATLKLWETETPCGGGRARDCGEFWVAFVVLTLVMASVVEM